MEKLKSFLEKFGNKTRPIVFVVNKLFKSKKGFAVVGVVVLLVISLLVLFTLQDIRKRSDLNIIIDAVYAYANEHDGRLPDTDGVDSSNNFPKKPTCIGNARACFNLAKAGSTASSETIVPSYLKELPKDPKSGTEGVTGYLIYKDADGHLVGQAKGVTGKTITVVR